MYEVGKNELQLPLPPLEKAQAQVGLRQKGVKRMPFWGENSLKMVGGALYGILFSLQKWPYF